jgi:hypothetical protein
MRLLMIVGVVGMTLSGVRAQEAIATLPDVYRLVLENEWVKVTRVTYLPHAKLPVHAHTAWAAAYVYLTDSGPVMFKHVGGQASVVTRPPAKAGSFRLFRAVGEEVHEVENLSPHLSDFLRVEFKTQPDKDPRTLRGRFFPEAHTGRADIREQFVNEQLRVIRIVLPRGTSVDMSAGIRPSLLVFVSAADAGSARWVPPGHTERLGNATADSLELLRFELRTDPVAHP